jgi:hypothetical protein
LYESAGVVRVRVQVQPVVRMVRLLPEWGNAMMIASRFYDFECSHDYVLLGERAGGEVGSTGVHGARIMSEMFVFTATDPEIRYQAVTSVANGGGEGATLLPAAAS